MPWMSERDEERLRYDPLTSRLMLTVAGIWLCAFWIGSWTSTIALLGEAIRNGGATLAVLCRIPDAVATLREEQRRLQDERDAFQEFARRVAALEDVSSKQGAPSPDQPGEGNNAMLLRAGDATQSAPKALPKVREIYRDTVMAVPHYEEDYDEPLKTNMAVEFGPEIAATVATGETLSPQLKTALVQSAQQAQRERSSFLQLLENEREHIISAKQRLRRLHDNVDTIESSLQQRSARELVEQWKRLDTYEETCRDLLHDRQSQLHETIENRTDMEVQEYLNQTVDWTYPVLNDGLDCVSRIRDVKRDVVAAFLKWG